MVILPCIEFLFTGSYVTYVFLLMYVFGLILMLLRGR